jgi:uncharacterized protein (DUF1501 family)
LFPATEGKLDTNALAKVEEEDEDVAVVSLKGVIEVIVGTTGDSEAEEFRGRIVGSTTNCAVIPSKKFCLHPTSMCVNKAKNKTAASIIMDSFFDNCIYF